jgi:1-acyl-sn-glycerol-3-phosphate acyltransferase
MIYYISRTILYLFFKIFFRYSASGTGNIPRRGGVIIASNHLSFLDPAAAGFITMRRVHFLARETLFDNPLFNWWGRSVGAVPVKRGRLDLSAMKACLRHLKKGEVISLFPEGTRSRNGIIQDPKAGVGYLAANAGVPIVPVLITGSDRALPPHAAMIRLKRVKAVAARAVEPKAFLNKDGGYDYQAISDEVMRRIRKLSEDDPATLLRVMVSE